MPEVSEASLQRLSHSHTDPSYRVRLRHRPPPGLLWPSSLQVQSAEKRASGQLRGRNRCCTWTNSTTSPCLRHRRPPGAHGSETERAHREGHRTLDPRDQARAPMALPGACLLEIHTVCAPSAPESPPHAHSHGCPTPAQDGRLASRDVPGTATSHPTQGQCCPLWAQLIQTLLTALSPWGAPAHAPSPPAPAMWKPSCHRDLWESEKTIPGALNFSPPDSQAQCGGQGGRGS